MRWERPLLLGLLCLLVGCSDEPSAKAPPLPRAIAFAEGTFQDTDGTALLSFGRVGLGRVATAVVVVENLTERWVEISTQDVPPPFFLEEPHPTAVAPRGRTSLRFLYVPDEETDHQARVVISSRGGGLTVVLQGRGIEIGARCSYSIQPSSLLLNAAGDGPRLPRRIPLTIEVDRGPCTIEAVRTEGALPLEVSIDEGLVLLPGTTVEAVVQAEAYEPGLRGDVVFTLAGEETKVSLETVEEPTCMQLLEEELRFNQGLGCERSLRAHFPTGCDAPARLTSAQLWPQEAEEAFDLQVFNGADPEIVVTYLASNPMGKDEALAVLDFDNGDRLHLPLLGEAEMVEQEFEVPPASVDLLFVVDKGLTMEPFQEAIGDFATAVSDWVKSTLQDVWVGVTTTAISNQPPCMEAEGGRLLPLDGAGGDQVLHKGSHDLEEKLRQNLLVESCMPHGSSQGLEAVVQSFTTVGPGWLRQGSRRVVFFISAEDDVSPAAFGDYTTFFVLAPITNVFGILPDSSCEGAAGELGNRYRTMVQEYSGLFARICEPDEWKAVLAGVEASGAKTIYLPLVEPADPVLHADEKDGFSLWHGTWPLPSIGTRETPGWRVLGGMQLALEWGFPPGTKLKLRYPPGGSACR